MGHCGGVQAQLVLERIYCPEVVEVAELDDTDRGAGGFGSTGTSGTLKRPADAV